VRGLALDQEPQSTCHDYLVFMRALARESYAAQATALWAVEYAYNQAWQLPGLMAPPYREYAERWGNPGFTEYVEHLRGQADEALEMAEDDERREAELMFLKVAELENGFWQMAFENPA
jgi:thiaminase/transcriptional activator TenA